MPQETKQKFEANSSASVDAGDRYAQGAVIDASTVSDPSAAEELRRALDAAFDYRGDITLTLRSGGVIEGYLFDRRTGATLEASIVRLIPSNSTSSSGEEKVTVRYADIAALSFSGKDTAAGKGWENWVRRYAEKKLKGEAASIESEKLD
jgi:hypothetical protein